MQLSGVQRDLLALIGRTPENAEGWRAVSGACSVFFRPGARHPLPPELYEYEPFEVGGRVRLTETGKIVLSYL